MAKSAKLRKFGKILLILGFSLGIVLFGIYQLVQSPRFIRFMINRINQTLPGKISYDVLNIDLNQGHLLIKNIAYQDKDGTIIFKLPFLEADFDPIKAAKAQFHVKRLRASGLRLIQPHEIRKVSTWRRTIRLVLKRLSIEDALIDDIEITLRNGDHLNFNQATLSLSPQKKGKQTINLLINQSEGHIGKLAIHSSTLSLKGDIAFPLFRDYAFVVRKAKGLLKLDKIVINQFPPISLESSFQIDGNEFTLDQGRLHYLQEDFALSAKYVAEKAKYALDLQPIQPLPFTIFPKMHKEVMETFKNFSFHLNTEMEGKKLDDLDGKISLEMQVFGNTANPETPEQKLFIKGPVHQGVLTLDDFRIESAKTTVKASGKIDFSKRKFDTKVETKNFDLATMVQALSDIDLKGYADAQGTIRGDFTNPDFDIQTNAASAGYSFLSFSNVTGDFKIHDNFLTFTGGISQGGETAKVEVKTENIFKKNKHTTLKTEFNNLDVATLVDNPEFKGKISGTFEMEDFSETPPKGTLKANIPDFYVLNFHLGEVNAEGKLENEKFILNPISFQPPHYEKITLPREAVFSFDERGIQLKGEVLPGAEITGNFLKSNPNRFDIEATFKKLDLRPLLAAWELKPIESYADGKIKMAIGLNKTLSEIAINLTDFRLPFEETEIRAAEPIDIEIHGPRINFKRARFRGGDETFGISGSWMIGGPLDLSLNGKWDLALLKLFPEFFRETSGSATLDLKVRGTFEKPSFSGDITFNDGDLNLRGFRGHIENLRGRASLAGNSLVFENLQGTMSEGDITLNGRVELAEFKPRFFDLKIEAREATFAEPGNYKLVISSDLSLKGPVESPVLSGTVFLTEGRYSRDFNIAQFILKAKPKSLPSEPNPYLSNLKLDLAIKSSGELEIKNNVAEMYLQTDLQVKGSVEKPEVHGVLEILEGKFKYFRVEFEHAQGIIDFRDPSRGPYVDVVATKEFTQRYTTVNVSAHIFGYTDNLQLNFTSDSGLQRQDMLALVFTGSFPGEGGFSSTQLASTVLASQLSGILQGTLAEKAQLDIFRLEASDPEHRNLTTLVVGKQLTPRLSLEFKTDLGVDDPLQGIQMEYLIWDNLLMEASQLSNGSFDLSMTLRWRSF